MMSEIRIKPRNLIIYGGLLVLVVFLVARRSNCFATMPSTTNSRRQPQQGQQPIIYAITPTYARPVQKAELTRLSQTIMLVPNIHWIIIEDAVATSDLVRSLLQRANLLDRSTQLNAKTPTDFKLKDKDPNWSKPRGVEQRNAGLAWVRNKLAHNKQQSADSRATTNSIIFFMDDDNTYSVGLFEEMAKIRSGRVGVWPVGLVGGLMVEKPVLDESTNEVIGFNSAWRPERPFPIDMAGFAISGDLLMDFKQAVFSYEVQRGYQESEILRHLTVVRDLQPLANRCRDVLVWHTRTESPKLDAEVRLKKTGEPRSDVHMEV